MGEQYLSHKTKLSVGIFLATTFIMLGAGCSLWNGKNQITKAPLVVNDGTLAQVLLSATDVARQTGMENARPQLLELNHHLDATIPNDYNFYVARSWYDRPSSNILMQNAITQFVDAAGAKATIIDQAKQHVLITIPEPVGDTAVAYYQAASDTDPATLVYRFTIGEYAAKVQLFLATNAPMSDTETQNVLLPIATSAIKIQAAKLTAFLSGNYVVPEPNVVMKKLPTTLTGTTYIGTVPMTDPEWLGVSFDMERDNLIGYKTGGVSRFELKNKPGEVVEVVVMEFDTAEHAKTFQEELKAGVDGKTTTKIDLPNDLTEKQTVQADAIHRSGLVELQALANYDNTVIDISIFAPFANDDNPSADDLIRISKEAIGNFNLSYTML